MKIYTVDEIAEILKLGPQSVRKLINNGLIKKLDTLGSVRITEIELRKYLEGK